MSKQAKIIGCNPVAIDHFGNLTPINGKVYKNKEAVLAAAEKGGFAVGENFAGFAVLDVYGLVDAKVEAPKKEVKPTPKFDLTTVA